MRKPGINLYHVISPGRDIDYAMTETLTNSLCWKRYISPSSGCFRFSVLTLQADNFSYTSFVRFWYQVRFSFFFITSQIYLLSGEKYHRKKRNIGTKGKSKYETVIWTYRYVIDTLLEYEIRKKIGKVTTFLKRIY